MGAVAKSRMEGLHNIYEGMRKYLVIYEESVRKSQRQLVYVVEKRR